MRPRLLDLYAGAGGAAMGYAQAGFEVVGVDIAPMPNYPFEFHQLDALRVLESCDWDGVPLWDAFSAIQSSPPCQHWTAYKRTGNVGEYPDLIGQTRELLKETGLPYVIENVMGAPLEGAVMLCGTMFDPPLEIQRHRYFEANWDLRPPDWPCRHLLNGPDRYPGGRSVERGGVSTYPVRRTMEIGSWDIPLPDQKAAMGVDWKCTLEELSEMVPPIYTSFIGAQLLEAIS